MDLLYDRYLNEHILNSQVFNALNYETQLNNLEKRCLYGDLNLANSNLTNKNNSFARKNPIPLDTKRIRENINAQNEHSSLVKGMINNMSNQVFSECLSDMESSTISVSKKNVKYIYQMRPLKKITYPYDLSLHKNKFRADDSNLFATHNQPHPDYHLNDSILPGLGHNFYPLIKSNPILVSRQNPAIPSTNKKPLFPQENRLRRPTLVNQFSIQNKI